MQKIKTVADISCQGKRVFLRADFNVPLDEKGNVSDDSRVVAALPTIRYLIQSGAKVILASHLGRPNGERIIKYSMRNVALSLAKHLGQPVLFLPDCIGDEVLHAVNKMADGTVVLLENLRFYKEETDNDPKFAEALAALADIYVNDAFGSAHRAHASTDGITKFTRENVAGLLMEKELEFLGARIANPERPFVVILGGAKISDKISVIYNLLQKANSMLIGGAMAYTFLAAKGISTGSSPVETDKIPVAAETIRMAESMGVKLIFPVDHVVAAAFDKETMTATDVSTSDGEIPAGKTGIDIGPRTVELFGSEIASAKTIFWNGPMGIFEMEGSSAGTFAIAKAVARPGVTSIIGGGDSARAIAMSGVGNSVSFVSTGGGAGLKFLEGGTLPSVEVLDKLYNPED
ncbi:MAG: phosphoglycerate kinase [Puniceicoccales bacterium]|jgi:3-phosphoglycerate kinase|nr:phosphoglycerate kinase [Puniceicoccales bacterium]